MSWSQLRCLSNMINNQQLIAMYIKQHLTLREIAPLLGISYPAVWKRLRRCGITGRDGEYVIVNCSCCSKEKRLLRSKWKLGGKFYCDRDCMAVDRHSNPYLKCTKLARVIVKQYFALQDSHVVVSRTGVYEKRDLMVFRSEEDYLAYCHGSKVRPIWDGR